MLDQEKLKSATRRKRGLVEARFHEFREDMENEITDPYERLVLYSVVATKSRNLVSMIGKELEDA